MITLLLVGAVALSVVGSLLLLAQFLSLFTDAPYVPTSHARVAAMITLAEVRPGMRVVDLGSGDGRLVAAAARAGAYAEGWEANILLVWWSRWLLWRQGLSARARIRYGRYHGRDFRDQDVLFLYILAKEMARLEQWLPAAIGKQTRIIVHAFPFPQWTPTQKNGTLYCYKRPL